MRAIFLILSLTGLLLVSCQQVPTRPSLPQPVPVPASVDSPDSDEVEKAVENVERSVSDVKTEVEDVQASIDSLKETTDTAREAADLAFERGLEVGSAAAAELRSQVSKISEDLQTTTEKLSQATAAIDKAQLAINSLRSENAKLISDVSTLEKNRNDLKLALDTANARINTAGQDLLEAKVDYKDLESKYEDRAKYVWITWTLAGLLVIFVILRVLAASGRISLPI